MSPAFSKSGKHNRLLSSYEKEQNNSEGNANNLTTNNLAEPYVEIQEFHVLQVETFILLQ